MLLERLRMKVASALSEAAEAAVRRLTPEQAQAKLLRDQYAVWKAARGANQGRVGTYGLFRDVSPGTPYPSSLGMPMGTSRPGRSGG